jgi:hypothetical protein
LRSAIKIYGDPQSKIFTQSENRDYFEALLQHLIVLIRGLGRIGNSSDLALFQKIKDNRQRFQNLGDTVRYEMLVKRITGWAEMAENSIRRNG